METEVQPQGSACGTCSGQTGIGTGFPLNVAATPCQSLFHNALYISVCHSLWTSKQFTSTDSLQSCIPHYIAPEKANKIETVNVVVSPSFQNHRSKLLQNNYVQ